MSQSLKDRIKGRKELAQLRVETETKADEVRQADERYIRELESMLQIIEKLPENLLEAADANKDAYRVCKITSMDPRVVAKLREWCQAENLDTEDRHEEQDPSQSQSGLVYALWIIL